MAKHSLKIGVLIAVIVLGGSLWVAGQDQKVANQIDYDNLTATIFNEPRTIQSFHLIDDQQQPFSHANLKGHFTFLFFGFTNCGGICPTTMAELAKVFRQLPASVLEKNPQVVFVTVDPERDTPNKLRAYLNSFNPAFIGVTGDPSALSRMRHELGILTMKKKMPKNQQNNPDNLDHSGTILLINPDGKYMGVFSMPHQAEAIVSDFTLLSQKSG